MDVRPTELNILPQQSERDVQIRGRHRSMHPLLARNPGHDEGEESDPCAKFEDPGLRRENEGRR